jgi:hypothetical protein
MWLLDYLDVILLESISDIFSKSDKMILLLWVYLTRTRFVIKVYALWMWKFGSVVKRNMGYFLYPVATEEINCKREKEGTQ